MLCLTSDCKEFIPSVGVKIGTGKILDKKLYSGYFQGQSKMPFAPPPIPPPIPTEIASDQLHVLTHS